jgi:hypothetical protein
VFDRALHPFPGIEGQRHSGSGGERRGYVPSLHAAATICFGLLRLRCAALSLSTPRLSGITVARSLSLYCSSRCGSSRVENRRTSRRHGRNHPSHHRERRFILSRFLLEAGSSTVLRQSLDALLKRCPRTVHHGACVVQPCQKAEAGSGLGRCFFGGFDRDVYIPGSRLLCSAGDPEECESQRHSECVS